MTQQIVLVGLNHRTAPVSTREKFALTKVNNEDFKSAGDCPVREVLILSTCNRVEILGVGDLQEKSLNHILTRWSEICQAPKEELQKYVYCYQGLEAVGHIFTVASSLDSMVVGEPQILGQLKDAYRIAVDEGTSRVILNRLMHKAFFTAKRIRTETKIAQSAVSISYAAVELAKDIFDDLSEQRAILLGAGEMAELAASHLLNSGLKKLLITNRTYDRARELADCFEATPVPYGELYQRLAEVDIVISSTGAERTIIQAKDVLDIMKKRKYRPMFFIDIAVPRDIDPDVNSLDNVYLYDIDDLKGVIEENLIHRKEEAERAQNIVLEEVQSFRKWLSSLELNPTIIDLLQQGENVARKEIEKTLKKLGPDVSPEVSKAVETLAISLSKKLYHHPITFLKRKANEEDSAQYFISLTRRMFDLDQENVQDDVHSFKKKRN